MNATIISKSVGSALLLLGLLGGCQSTSEQASTTAAPTNENCLPEETAASRQTVVVQHAPAVEVIKLTGKVNYNPDKVVRFVPLLAGVVDRVTFSLGDYVKKGQVLLEIRSSELSSLQTDLKTAQAELRMAERSLSSTRDMYEDKLASEKDLIQAENEVEMAKQAIRKATETLQLYGGSLEKGVLVIRAPANGYIVEKTIVAGQQIESGGDPLFTISDLKQVWITANVYAGNLHEVQEGMPVEIKTTAYPDRVFYGKINRFSNVFDANERVMKAQIFMDNPGLMLKPEMFVNVLARKQRPETALVVPTKAVVFDNDQYFLVKYQDECHLQLINLKPLYQSNDSTFFKGGMESGERVLMSNPLLVYNQLKQATAVN
ncbi:efflux RND transporter periplasmic adaptor subunit [Larkinella harenae]